MFDELIASLDTVQFARALLIALLPVALFGPRSWAVLAWLALTNIDATGPGVGANHNIGWLNAFKGLGLPLILLWRFRAVPGWLQSTWAAYAWIALTLYAGLAILWSEFPLAGAKITANMAGILLTVLMLERAARSGCLSPHAMVAFFAISLGFGAIQTFVFGGQVFGFSGTGQAARFTSFVSAQQFAALLVAFLCFLLWTAQPGPLARVAAFAGVAAALLWNGSRTWVIGAMLAGVMVVWLRFRKVGAWAMCAAGLAVLALLAALNLATDQSSLTRAFGRLGATVSALSDAEDPEGADSLGTFNFRMVLYTGVLQELAAADTTEILFGHGTSSGGGMSLLIFPGTHRDESLDPNRSVHNEWLRVQYEWGVAGLALFLTACLGLFVYAVSAARDSESNRAAGALLCYVPALGLALTTENVIAGAGNAVTVGLSLLIAFTAASARVPEPGMLAWAPAEVAA